MKLDQFQFDLPPGLIAQQPRERGRSRLLLLDPAVDPPLITHESFERFDTLLGKGDVLVLNDTAVFPARLIANRKGKMLRGVELLLSRRLGPFLWEALCKPARKVRQGETLFFSGGLEAFIEQKGTDGSLLVRLNFDGDLLWTLLDSIGETPLPPYIRRSEREDSDRDAYQTVYASRRGAVAAPTAGLHFTPSILAALAARGAEIVPITLHVGTGTFKPVKVEDISLHQMDLEHYEISVEAAAAVNRALSEGRRIVAAGTTSVRALESAILAGSGKIQPGPGETRLFVTPGFRFQVVSALLTNFHLPGSTLLMLVSAFAGLGAVQAAYHAAIRESYFFYSYGDCMFITRRGA